MSKILTITTATQSKDRFYNAWKEASICPRCTPSREIHWADLIADRVKLCPEHQPEKEGQLPLSGDFE